MTALTYVGIGFGAIQAGLFLYEAWRSGHFDRLVVAEVVPEVVEAIRAAGGSFSINIAHADRIESVTVGPIDIYNPNDDHDREQLIQAIAGAQEIGTAVPSIKFYQSDGKGSLHRLLGAGLQLKQETGGPRAVIYAAENDNYAAEKLSAAVETAIPPADHAAVLERVRFLNTVIGKMSGMAEDAAGLPLLPVTPGSKRAWLVEAFNRILISRIDYAEPFQRGLDVFIEKPDLLPFEEAKLYGHNAVHAMAAYLARLLNLPTMDLLRGRPAVMAFLREAFLIESGGALMQKYNGLDDLFTQAGYTAYADDLLQRMTNPWLRDAVERVGRDPARKLGADDRLIGTMRLALRWGIQPRRFGMGAAAALAALDPALFSSAAPLDSTLDSLWVAAPPSADEQAVLLNLIADGRERLHHWLAGSSLVDG
jgi:mannitol-1-phosphate 5-dehydrogenase